MKRISISIIAAILLLVVSISVITLTRTEKNISSEQTNVNSEEVFEEMRGLWVSFITLDMSGTDRSFDSFKSKFDKILSDAISYKVNTLIVQIRPFSDALYKSDIYPSSHVLWGEQGAEESYDALEYMCSAAHKKNIKIHAWINPYRIATKDMPSTLSPDNPFYIEDIGFETGSGKYLNPAKRSARDIIVRGVAEIVEKYPVDGIQFDDYFYPTDCDDFDDEDYNAYLKGTPNQYLAMKKNKWRENNVNMLISEVFRKIKSINPKVKFGLSPQGNVENCYSMGADVKTWCEIYGYVDYICPQMYYSIENPAKSFRYSLEEWKEFSYHESIKVYVGLGAYKAGTDADGGTWESNTQELKNQLELLRKYGYDGYMIYDYSALCDESKSETLTVFKSFI